jgi:hypothetical protein
LVVSHARLNVHDTSIITVESDKALRCILHLGINMSKTGVATHTGKNVAVFPTDDVCLIFKEVTRTGLTSVAKLGKGPEPPSRYKIRQYYRIQTTAEHSPPVEIRIILPLAPDVSARPRLWRWYGATKEWKDVTKFFSRKYSLVVGETGDRLESIFAIT